MDCGYRHIDTAFNYNNEDAIGRSLKQWLINGGKREELFITTKVRIYILICLVKQPIPECNFFQLPHYGNRSEDVEKYINWSLKKLGLDYIDMYLIHMPFAFVCDKTGSAPVVNEDGTYVQDIHSNPVAVWKVLNN